MFRHIIAFKFKDDATEEQINGAVEALKAIKQEVPEIRSFAMGPNRNTGTTRPMRYNWIMSMDFDNQEDHLVYEHSAAHDRVKAEVLLPIVQTLTSLDYDLELNKA